MSNWQTLPDGEANPVVEPPTHQSVQPTVEPLTVPPSVEKEPQVAPTETLPMAPKMEDAPTDSHALATEDHDDKGAAQLEHTEPEVKDLGWDEKPEHIPAPLVGGLANEDLWVLVRRFNKVYLAAAVLMLANVPC
jgi:Protein of unknown function (DUF3292)